MVTQDDWFDLVCESSKCPVFFEGTELPAFPSDELQTLTTGQSGASALKDAFVFYQDCMESYQALGVPMKRQSQLLDFGVGWGRIARSFLRDLPLSNIHGVDVMSEFVDICKQTFRSDNFLVTAPFPPSVFPDNYFNYIVGYSVFSHLSENACREWMREFYRITQPGSIVAITTRGRPFFDYSQSLKGKGLGSYADSLSVMFNDFDEAKARYDRGEFVHSNAYGIAGAGAMNSSFYGESFIPEQYARDAYKDFFVLENFTYDPLRQSHPIMFFRRK
jgi:hypothetical protein